MRALIDGHTLIWAVDDPAKLSPAARTTMQNPANELLVSTATIWEIAIQSWPRQAHLVPAIPGLDEPGAGRPRGHCVANYGGICRCSGKAAQSPPRPIRPPTDSAGLGGRTGHRECGCWPGCLWRDSNLVEGVFKGGSGLPKRSTVGACRQILHDEAYHKLLLFEEPRRKRSS